MRSYGLVAHGITHQRDGPNQKNNADVLNHQIKIGRIRKYRSLLLLSDEER
jgi:hypothetical protein